MCLFFILSFINIVSEDSGLSWAHIHPGRFTLESLQKRAKEKTIFFVQ